MYRRVLITAFTCLAAAAQAQHSLSHTFTVDPSGSADYTTIQGAINAIPALSRPATVLVYAGTYAEAVTLSDPEIDIVGIDRAGVVIKPPADTDAITITGNGERLNTIRNLTIWTDDDTAGEGRGIVIENSGGADPTDITIDGVTFRIDGANSDAILLDDRAHSIEISNVTVLGAAEDTIKGVCVTGGTSADPSLDITISNVVMLLDGCSAKGVAFEDEAENVTITGLIVRKPSFGGRGIEAEFATNLTVENCDILAHDGDGLIVGPNTVVRDSSIVVRRDYGSDDGCGSSADDKPGITVGDVAGVLIDGCYLEGRFAGLSIGTDAQDVTVVASDIKGGVAGVGINGASDVSISNCRIAGDSDLGSDSTLPPKQHYGVRVLGTTSGLSVASSVISARSTTSKDAMGVLVEVAPTDRPLQVLDCVVSASVTSAAIGVAHAVESKATDGIAMIGGSADAMDGDERETDIYDIYNASNTDVRVRTSGTKFSRWKGAVGAAVGERAAVQRVVNVPSVGAATVLAATALLGTEQSVSTGISDPKVFRVLSVTGNTAGMDQTVIIVGLDWGLRPIADAIELDGTNTVNGVKAFRKVTKIILPAQNAGGQSVSVGTAEILGLHAPISLETDLQQVGQKASAASAYTLLSTLPDVSVERGTVDISGLSPANNDSIVVHLSGERMTMRHMRATIGVGCLAAVNAAAQPCEPAWDVGIGNPGVNSSVVGLLLHDLGAGEQLLAGGLFWKPYDGMAAWDGRGWFRIGSPLQGIVLDFLRFDDGNGEKLYIVGNLYVGGDDLWHVARLDGHAWTFLDHGDVNNSVNRMAVWDDGTGPGLYVTGDFDTLDGVTTHNGIAKWDGTQWHPLNGGMTSVNFPNIGLALEVFDDGSGEQLYLGGTFQRVDGMPFFYLARWDGSEWSDVGNGQPSLSVTDMCVHDDGSGTALYIVGDFSSVAGMEMNHVARWDGIEWSDLDRGTQRQSSGVNACAVFDDGGGPALYISGGISEASGKPMCNIAKWDGTEWHNPAGGLDCTGNQGAFAMLGLPPDSPFGPSMFAGGSFSQAGGQATNFIAEYRGCHCRPDLNDDGAVNTQDFLTFLNLWVANDPIADWNTDGTINTRDFTAYLNEWVEGC